MLIRPAINASKLVTNFNTYQYLLDLYPNAAVAYSFRILSKNYTGNCIRVRRSSDNTEQDFGFVNNYLDVAGVETFCASTNGFIVTRYDQSGNANNNTQTTAAQQVKCVDNGVFYVEDGFNCSYNNNNAKMPIVTALNLNTNYAVFAVAKPINSGDVNLGAGMVFGSRLTLSYYWANYFSVNQYLTTVRTFTNTYSAPAGTNYNLSLLFMTNDNTNLEIGNNNNVEITATDNQTFELSILETGFFSSDFYRFNGYYFEFIAYQNYPNVNGVKTNINNYYGIY